MLWNALLLALREIGRNKMRSTLTMLGIIIGVSAVITMVTVGRGATAQVAAEIASLGSNLLQVRPGARYRGPGGVRAPSKSLKLADAVAIANEVTGVAAVAPAATKGALAVYANSNWNTSVTGTDNAFFPTRNWEIAKGRTFTDDELRGGRPACILGETVRKELFGSKDSLGEAVRIEKISCQVIGVLAAKGASPFGSDQDDAILIPLKTFQRRLAGNQDVDIIFVSAERGEIAHRVKGDIESLMRQRRRTSPPKEDDFFVRDMKEVVARVTSTTRTMTALLGAVAAVSLLVGGIGIMNIMLVSVIERTREIGIRMAIGARERDILLQFLVEAVVLSSAGGVAGIVLGIAASAAGARILAVPLVLGPDIVLLAFGFSAMVGIVFGYFPARQAARLDPIEALRHE
ncbi:MAG: ABC transporter permease [Rhodospirillales bacterium]|nr:ABC transporter permease [Rhodospirillales bacterium]MCW8953153.1 ABC transporter permease [Rhodospirillales bacterium]MCW9002417.1 ABC transporter permease [Rhodospirillales bacterium]